MKLSVERAIWDRYWQSRSLKRRIIEAVKAVYFARMFEALVKRTQATGLVLEAGCGSGKILRHLRSEHRMTVGCDYSLAAARTARANCDFVVVCDIHHLPFSDDRFSLVFNQGVMEHFEHPEFVSILGEFRRVSPRVLIIAPSATSPFRIWNPFGELDQVFFSKEDLRKLVSSQFPRVQASYLPQSFFLSVACYGER